MTTKNPMNLRKTLVFTFGGAVALTLVLIWNSGLRSGHALLQQRSVEHEGTEDSNDPAPIQNSVASARPAIDETTSSRENTAISAQDAQVVVMSTLPSRSVNGTSSAVIGLANTSPHEYTVGAVLPNGARITEIGTDYIVAERDGLSKRIYTQGSVKAPDTSGRLVHTNDLVAIGASQATNALSAQ